MSRMKVMREGETAPAPRGEDRQITIHGPEDFAAMHRAGRLAARGGPMQIAPPVTQRLAIH